MYESTSCYRPENLNLPRSMHDLFASCRLHFMASNPHVGLAFRFMEESESLSYSEVGSFKAVVLIPWDHALMTSLWAQTWHGSWWARGTNPFSTLFFCSLFLGGYVEGGVENMGWGTFHGSIAQTRRWGLIDIWSLLGRCSRFQGSRVPSTGNDGKSLNTFRQFMSRFYELYSAGIPLLMPGAEWMSLGDAVKQFSSFSSFLIGVQCVSS